MFFFSPRLLSERHVKCLQQRFRFCVGIRSGANYDIHTPDFVYFIVVDFRENDVFFQTHCIVATTVKRLVGNSAEIAKKLANVPFAKIGRVVETPTITIKRGADELSSVALDEMLENYKSTLDGV